MRIEPFTPRVPDSAIEDLRARLERTRFPDALPDTGWTYGADLDTMRTLRDHWLHRFDWRAQEAELARWHHHRAPDLGIHFVHERGAGPRPFPLVITHGWPGSFLEILPIVPLLTHPPDPADAFDVVVPSLPGYGYSDRPTRPGMDPFRTAEIWDDLMRGLGYPRYGAQGGDMGAAVSTVLGLRHAASVAAIHLNYIPGSYRPFVDGEPTAAEKQFLADADDWWARRGAYGHVQRNEPQTLAFALNDSPMGLAAWIVTKLREWADCDGRLERRFTFDEILTHVSLYWFTETIGSSCRRYFDGRLAPLHFGRGDRVSVPCGIARFPKEEPFPPREWIERGYDVARWTEMPRGGHFASMEEPALLAEDIRGFFRPYRV